MKLLQNYALFCWLSNTGKSNSVSTYVWISWLVLHRRRIFFSNRNMQCKVKPQVHKTKCVLEAYWFFAFFLNNRIVYFGSFHCLNSFFRLMHYYQYLFLDRWDNTRRKEFKEWPKNDKPVNFYKDIQRWSHINSRSLNSIIITSDFDLQIDTSHPYYTMKFFLVRIKIILSKINWILNF